MSNEPDKVNSGALATILVILALSTLAVALVVTALVRDETNRLRAQGDVKQERSYRQLRAEQETKLNASAWVDKEAGLAQVPVKTAQAMVLESIRENPLALSPGNPPEDEEEDEEGDEEGASEDEAADQEASEEEASEEEAAEEEDKAGEDEASEKDTKAPAPKAPVAPAPTAPAPKAPVPTAPGGPTE